MYLKLVPGFDPSVVQYSFLMKKPSSILKLEKKGDLYTAYCSSDGLDFKKVGTAEIFRKQPSLNHPLKWLLIIYG